MAQNNTRGKIYHFNIFFVLIYFMLFIRDTSISPSMTLGNIEIHVDMIKI